jgi:hypothetical protein
MAFRGVGNFFFGIGICDLVLATGVGPFVFKIGISFWPQAFSNSFVTLELRLHLPGILITPSFTPWKQ